MRIEGTQSLATSAVQLIQSGRQELLQAVRQTASGNIDELAGAAVAVLAARDAQQIGVRLAKVADDMMKSTLDMLA